MTTTRSVPSSRLCRPRYKTTFASIQRRRILMTTCGNWYLPMLRLSRKPNPLTWTSVHFNSHNTKPISRRLAISRRLVPGKVVASMVLAKAHIALVTMDNSAHHGKVLSPRAKVRQSSTVNIDQALPRSNLPKAKAKVSPPKVTPKVANR